MATRSEPCTSEVSQRYASRGIRVGYIGARLGSHHEDVAVLLAAGCRVVRREDSPDGSVLWAILSFLGPEDELVLFALSDLVGLSALEVLDRLSERGASLYVLDDDLSTRCDGERHLRSALKAVACLQPKRRLASRLGIEHAIRSLERSGAGPSEIARRLGISRMTVWRKLKKHGAGTARV